MLTDVTKYPAAGFPDVCLDLALFSHGDKQCLESLDVTLAGAVLWEVNEVERHTSATWLPICLQQPLAVETYNIVVALGGDGEKTAVENVRLDEVYNRLFHISSVAVED